jgi:hypothetical protein
MFLRNVPKAPGALWRVLLLQYSTGGRCLASSGALDSVETEHQMTKACALGEDAGLNFSTIVATPTPRSRPLLSSMLTG